jgi:hypothetical protein
MKPGSYIAAVDCLTKQEKRVVWVVVILLLTGGAVRIYRAARPPVSQPGGATPVTVVSQPAKP